MSVGQAPNIAPAAVNGLGAIYKDSDGVAPQRADFREEFVPRTCYNKNNFVP